MSAGGWGGGLWVFGFMAQISGFRADGAAEFRLWDFTYIFQFPSREESKFVKIVSNLYSLLHNRDRTISVCSCCT